MKSNRGYKVAITLLVVVIAILLYFFLQRESSNKQANTAIPVSIVVAPAPSVPQTVETKPAEVNKLATARKAVKRDDSAKREAARLEAERQQREAEEQARLEAQRQADEQVRLDAERKAREEQAKRDADADKLRREADEQARLEAERRAREFRQAEENKKQVDVGKISDEKIELLGIVETLDKSLAHGLRLLNMHQVIVNVPMSTDINGPSVATKEVASGSKKGDVKAAWSYLKQAKKTALQQLKNYASSDSNPDELVGKATQLYQVVRELPEKDKGGLFSLGGTSTEADQHILEVRNYLQRHSRQLRQLAQAN